MTSNNREVLNFLGATTSQRALQGFKEIIEIDLPNTRDVASACIGLGAAMGIGETIRGLAEAGYFDHLEEDEVYRLGEAIVKGAGIFEDAKPQKPRAFTTRGH